MTEVDWAVLVLLTVPLIGLVISGIVFAVKDRRRRKKNHAGDEEDHR